jgi:type IV pilus assembly protein PilZ
VVELRRYQRAPVDVALEYVVKGGPSDARAGERMAGRAGDISLGGMYVLTPAPLAFGTELVIHVMLPKQRVAFALPAVVRWVRAGHGMGVQFGLLGARETHAVTELTRGA